MALIAEWNFLGQTVVPTYGGATLTVSRTGASTIINAAGLVEAAVAGTPRFTFDPVTLAIKGLMAEEARTNVALYSRDLTNAAWTKTNATAALDQTGADGVANSASSLTATAANGTCLQAVVLASSACLQTAYVKRLVGTGTVEMTTDNGATWTAVVPTASWARAEIPSQTLANPTFGFRVVTSGDSIAVDYVQNASGVSATSPIPTTSAAVTRSAEGISASLASITGFSESTISVYVEAVGHPTAMTNTQFVQLDDGTSSNRHFIDQTAAEIPRCGTDTGGVSQGTVSVSPAIVADAVFRFAFSVAANDLRAACNGVLGTPDTTVTMPTGLTTLRVGSRNGNALQPNSPIRQVRIYNTALTDAELESLTTTGLLDASLAAPGLDLGASAAAAAAAMPNKEAVEGRAVIAYTSMLDGYDVTITASSETSGFSAQNVKSRLTHSGWKPSATGTQYLTFSASTNGYTVDYLGIAAHNLHSKAAVIALEYSDDGSSWTTLTAYAPTSDAPFMLLVDSTAKRYFRLAVTVSGVDYPTIGVVMLGERLSLQRGIYVGHRPAPFSRSITYNTSESEGGQIIGRSVVRRLNETEVSLKRITPTWFRSTLKAFLIAAEEQPFFFMWNTDSRYSGEVIYGVMANEPRPVNDHQSFMAVDLSIRGLA